MHPSSHQLLCNPDDSDRTLFRANLYLHILLRTHILLSIAWCVQAWLMYNRKLQTVGLSETDRAWYASVIVIWMVFEPLRLITGYYGNLQQSVAYLFGFLVFTASTYSGIMIVFTIEIPKMHALDKGFAIIMLVLAWLEFIPACRCLSTLVVENSMRFYINLGFVDEEDDIELQHLQQQ
eukprot:PhF_6_TR26041/c0_g1_i1/m.36666/K19384/TMEM17; transmembrane protein 17